MRLHFGDGGVDDAEDADVVVHEYGHSIQDNQVPGWGPGGNTEQRAMGEGFGDFLAGMTYLTTGNATYLSSYRYCIAEWDATAYNPAVSGNSGSGCLRWINGRSEVNGSDIGAFSGTPTEVHSDGRFWSAAMTCIYEGMGANATARNDIIRIILAHHFDLAPDASNNAFADSLNALVLEDQNLLDGSHETLIRTCGQQRLNVTFDTAPPVITVTTDASDTVAASGWYNIASSGTNGVKVNVAAVNQTGVR